VVNVRQKPPGLLVNRRGGRGRGLEVLVPAVRVVPSLPPAPAGLRWGEGVEQLWRDFWASPVSAAVDLQADGERLGRWLECIQEREALLAEVRAEGYAPAGVSHPHLVYIKHLDREIARLAERFGMDPLARFRLQLTFTEAGQSALKLASAREAQPVDSTLELVINDAS